MSSRGEGGRADIDEVSGAAGVWARQLIGVEQDQFSAGWRARVDDCTQAVTCCVDEDRKGSKQQIALLTIGCRYDLRLPTERRRSHAGRDVLHRNFVSMTSVTFSHWGSNDRSGGVGGLSSTSQRRDGLDGVEQFRNDSKESA